MTNQKITCSNCGLYYRPTDQEDENGDITNPCPECGNTIDNIVTDEE